MKKKITVILLMVCSIPLFSLAAPKDEAALSEDKPAETIVGGVTMAQIQQLITLKDSLRQGSKDALWQTITKNAIERTGNANTVNEIATVAAQLAGQDQQAVKENLVKVVETTIRSKIQDRVQEKVTDRLAGYQDEFALLSTLLNNGNNLAPETVD
ncbi:MAG: hypothetical protein ACRDBM_15555 [Sporomusa sp.]